MKKNNRKVIIYSIIAGIAIGAIWILKDTVLHNFSNAGSTLENGGNIEEQILLGNTELSSSETVSPQSEASIYFDGQTAQDISGTVKQNITAEEGTIMMWLKPEDLNSLQYAFSGVAREDTNRYYIQLTPGKDYSDTVTRGDRIRIFRGNNNSRASIDLYEEDYDKQEGQDTIFTDIQDKWYHVAMTWKPIDNEGNLQLKGYIDGKLVDIEEFQGTGINARFYIGGQGNKNFYKGFIDEPSYYPKAKTQSFIQGEIQEILSAQESNSHQPETYAQLNTKSVLGTEDADAFPGFITDEELENANVECSTDYGVIGKGCSFSNNSLNISSLVEEQLTAKEGTIMMWLNVDNFDERQYPIYGTTRDSDDYNRIYIQLEKAQTYSNGTSKGDRIRLFRGIKPVSNIDLIENPNTNEWYHIAMTWSTDSNGQTSMKGYINGEQVGSPKNFVNTTVANGKFYLGGRSSYDSYQGYIDEPQFHKTELSSTAIKDYYKDITTVPVEYTLTYNTGVNGTLQGETIQTVIEGGDGSVIEAVANENYVFSYWEESDGSKDNKDNPRIDANVQGDVTATARYRLVEPEDRAMFNIVRNDLTHIASVLQLGNTIAPRQPHKEGHPLEYTYVRNTFDQMFGMEMKLPDGISSEDEEAINSYYPDYDNAQDNGIDAMFMNMAIGWVPYWRTSDCSDGKSPYSDLLKHESWWRSYSNNGIEGDEVLTTKEEGAILKPYSTVISQFILEGDSNSCTNRNDFIDIMLEEARKVDKLGVISFSLNDHQGFKKLEPWNPENPSTIADDYNVTVNKFAKDHLDFDDNLETYSLIKYGDKDRAGNTVTSITDQIKDINERDLAQDWTYDEVRDYKLYLISSLIDNYDIDGIDLNFSRFPYIFEDLIPENGRTEEQRDIVIDFIIEVSKLIERKEKDTGKDLLLTITAASEDLNNKGLPIFFEDYNPENISRKIDYIIVQESYYSDIPEDIPVIREQVSDEIGLIYTFCHANGEVVESQGSTIKSNVEVKLTRPMINALAYLTYKQGVDGYAAFNFPYYEAYGKDQDIRGPWEIPPYDIFKTLSTTRKVNALEEFTYFIGSHNIQLGPYRKIPQLEIFTDIDDNNPENTYSYTKKLNTGDTLDLYINTYAPFTGWSKGILRIMANKNIKDSNITAELNGTQLVELKAYQQVSDTFNPLPIKYSQRREFDEYPREYNNTTFTWFRESYKYYSVPQSLMENGFSKNDLKFVVENTENEFSLMEVELSF